MGSIVVDILILPCFQQTEANPLQGFTGCWIVRPGGGDYPDYIIGLQKEVRVCLGRFRRKAFSPVRRTDKIGYPDRVHIPLVGAAHRADYDTVLFVHNGIGQILFFRVVFPVKLERFPNPAAHLLFTIPAVAENIVKAPVRCHFDIGGFILRL